MRLEPVAVPRRQLQQAVGVVALVGAAAFVPLLFAGKGAGAVALLSFVVFGAWWLIIEFARRMEQHEVNREYEEESARWEAAIREERRTWEKHLAGLQAEAKRQYDAAVRAWEATTDLIRGEARRRRGAVDDASRRVQDAERNWRTAATRIDDDFNRIKRELLGWRQRHEELARQHADERQRLVARAREMQLEQCLQQTFLTEGCVEGIGPGRLASLAAFGIETAADVKESLILQINGFGPKLTARLVGWRRSVEGRFTFDPRTGAPPHAQQALEIKYAQLKQQAEEALRGGEASLQAVGKRVDAELRPLHDHIRACLAVLAQAERDLTVIPAGY
jgi:DNA-binding helix-hairpin-helix protein with protein kinase domain